MHGIMEAQGSREVHTILNRADLNVPDGMPLLARKMQSRYEGSRVAGTFCPPFRSLNSTEADQVVDMINAMNPDIVWVGLSTPKQELWMAEFSKRLKARVLLGVGAAFDYNTDRLRRAPHWMQGLALEWLYRLIQEPKRLYKRYLVNGPVFLYRVLLQILGIRGYPVDTGSNKDSF
jgi:N-acetylglucosaminyldiphosphoundecaprenol N-acetyl-beta-D-mannosaminyltransferase